MAITGKDRVKIFLKVFIFLVLKTKSLLGKSHTELHTKLYQKLTKRQTDEVKLYLCHSCVGGNLVLNK
jgi:hypothetical protein